MADYSGTKITGTSTSAKVFKKSGLDWVRKGDYYRNTNTGHVYYCMHEGYPTKTKYWDKKSETYKYYEPATWKYDHTDIVGMANGKVKSLASPERQGENSTAYKSTWKVPSDLTSSKNGRRATRLVVTRRVDYENDKGKQHSVTTMQDYGTSKVDATVDISSSWVKVGKKSGTAAFFPYTGNVVKSVTISVAAINQLNISAATPPGVLVPGDMKLYLLDPKAAESETRKIAAPGKPKLAAPSLNTQTGVVTCSITPASDKGYKPRLRTRYQVEKKNVGSVGDGKWVLVTDSSSTSNSAFSISSGQLVNWMNVTHHWVVRFRARSEGIGGASGWTDWKYYGVGWPKEATLGDVVIKDATDPDSYGDLIIKDTNSSTDWPVDRVVLQLLKDVDATTPAEAAAEDWDGTDTDAEDDAKCEALSFNIGAAKPVRGKHTWVRVKSWRGIEEVFATFSDAKELVQLYEAAPSALDNKCEIVGDVKAADSTSVWVVVAWDSKSTSEDDDTTSMELSYSTDKDAWQCIDLPDAKPFDWHDSTVHPSAASSWNKSATIKVTGLEEGETYYFRARCVVETAESTEHGVWCTPRVGIPSSAPSAAVLSAPPSVATGSGIPVSWSFSGSDAQESWAVYPKGGKSPMASGDGPVQSAVIPADRVASFATNGRLEMHVSVSTGSRSVDSPDVAVVIADPPELSIGELADLTAQPLSIPLSCTSSTCTVAVTVSAQGATDQKAYGTASQPAGDTVWSSSVLPAWALDGSTGLYTADIELPSGRDFWDGAMYTVEAVAEDSSTGLSSEMQQAEFGVAWAHQAPLPPTDIMVLTEDAEPDASKTYYMYDSEEQAYTEVDEPVAADMGSYYEDKGVTVSPSVSTDEDGNVSRIVSIQLSAPQDAADGDVYDVYRVTGDGAQIIAEGLALDGYLTDTYAPFGEATHFYRICTRTFDGDTAWADFDYYLEGVGLRFDFEGDSHKYVELPWNVQEQDAYAKDFELSSAMDGTRAGAWNSAVSRTGTYQTDVIRVSEQAKVDAIRDLARAASAAFVRTSAGLAFAANVTVDSLDIEHRSKAIAVGFTATEIDQDESFWATVPVEDGD